MVNRKVSYPAAMTSRRQRADLIPNANNPRLLQRLVRLVASGIRKQRALADVLQVELRTVHYYTQAGEWLGLLDTDREVHLTPRGVEFAFAESKQRAKLYAKAVWSVPLVQSLLAQRGELPEVDVIASFILEHEPTMSPRTARRRATSLRGLVEPAIGHRPSRTEPQGRQLAFDFGLRTADPTPTAGGASTAPAVDLRAGTEHNPDIYARLLTALLDHGEITTGQIRALLDGMGASECPLGGYVDMAMRRSDVTRHADRLIVTVGASQRREFATDGVLVALTDPDYRRHIDMLLHPDPSPVGQRDQQMMHRRFSAWDQRIFGEDLTTENVHECVARPLVGRSLGNLPIADSGGVSAASTSAPFIDCLGVPGLMIAFPSSIRRLRSGIAWVNETLGRNRNAPAGVRPPDPLGTRAMIHGAVLCPSETLPRSIADTLTLRLRLLTHCPAFALLAVLLLLDRKDSVPVMLSEDVSGLIVHWGKQPLGPVLDVFLRFCRDQHWFVTHPITGGLTGRELIDTGIALGLCDKVSRRVVLAEPLFLRLQEDVEARMVYESILPLEDALHAWFERTGT